MMRTLHGFLLSCTKNQNEQSIHRARAILIHSRARRGHQTHTNCKWIMFFVVFFFFNPDKYLVSFEILQKTVSPSQIQRHIGQDVSMP